LTIPEAPIDDTVTFKYDPFGRRIYKSSSSGTSVYAYDGDNLIEETNASGGVVARYEQTQNIDEPLAMLRSSATSYFHADGLGSITSLSNSAGTLANTYTYDSYGNLTASTGSLVNSFQYTGREFDSETGLYYYRARYYDSTAGRFVSNDPIGFYAGVNSYGYANNSPISLLDPLGLCPCQKNNAHPFFPIRTGGILIGANGEAGLGSLGGSAVNGNIGFGESNTHMGLLASGAVATNSGNYAGGSPHQDVKTTGVYGAYVGGGQSFFFSNGQPCDLQGPFKTFNFNLGIGILNGSVSLALGENGVYQISVGNPFASAGIGLSVSSNTTNTKVSPCCN
jgi:RHS repeat-associated protein